MPAVDLDHMARGVCGDGGYAGGGGVKPLVVELFCGLGGWTEGFLAEGYDAIGFDIERHVYGDQKYPAQLVLQDVLTLHGSQFRNAACIVASPPCEEFTRHMLPWTKRKNPPPPSLALIDASFRIAKEASVPLVMENVREAQRYIGTANAHYGSRYLWGDVPAILPFAERSFKEHLSSSARALRAKIPFELARHIAVCYKPEPLEKIA
jgi:hypothetical protein